MIEKVKKMWPDWEVVDNLGSGTFGSVYEVHRKIFSHTDKAALKVLSIPKSKSDIQELLYNGYNPKSITERFKNHLEEIVKEYALMSELKGCANVVYCDDVRYIQHEDGIGWDIHIKMELLHPLISVLKNPVDEKQVVKIGLDICNALVLCNEKNIIHRDIKPQNLFVSDDGTFKLGDFGIAKTAEKTMGGTKTGTYNYMAPEVYNNQPYGAAVDQYSLGMVLYWLLNERRMPFFPLPPEIPTATQEEQARQKRMLGEMPPMPKNGMKDLKAIVMKAIAPNPADRFANIAEMKNALKAVEIKLAGYSDEVVDISLEDSVEEPIDVPVEDPADVLVDLSTEEDPADVLVDLSLEDVSARGTGEDLGIIEELTPSGEDTIGNSWLFDEGTSGSNETVGKLFNDFDADGTVGVDNQLPNKEENEKERLEEIKSKPASSGKETSEAESGDLIEALKKIAMKKELEASGKNTAQPEKREEANVGPVVFSARNDNHSPLSLANGSTYMFIVDNGDKKIPVVAGPRDKNVVESITIGKTHTVEVMIYASSDKTYSKKPVYTCPPVSFEVRPGYTTRVVANRPSTLKKLKVEVRYEKI